MIVDAHTHIFGYVCRNIASEEFPDGHFPIERLAALMDRCFSKAEGAQAAPYQNSSFNPN